MPTFDNGQTFQGIQPTNSNDVIKGTVQVVNPVPPPNPASGVQFTPVPSSEPSQGTSQPTRQPIQSTNSAQDQA